MVKANDLIKEQKERENKKKETFEKILLKIEKKIIFASSANNYFTGYLIPEFILGLPFYSIDDCKEYLQKKLEKNGFETEFFEPNVLIIKWFPKDKDGNKDKDGTKKSKRKK
jgi:hypothetical protein